MIALKFIILKRITEGKNTEEHCYTNLNDWNPHPQKLGWTVPNGTSYFVEVTPVSFNNSIYYKYYLVDMVTDTIQSFVLTSTILLFYPQQSYYFNLNNLIISTSTILLFQPQQSYYFNIDNTIILTSQILLFQPQQYDYFNLSNLII